jgi:hypothetical protein
VGSEAGGVVTAVTPSREALAKALCVLDYDCPEGEDWCESCDHGGGYRKADRLIASGAVVPLDTLAADMGLMERVLDTSEELATTPLDRAYPRAIPLVLHALAAALSERGDR